MAERAVDPAIQEVGARMTARLSILACVSGRFSLFRRHLDSLARQPAAGECEYVVAAWGDAERHRDLVASRAGHFQRVSFNPIMTDRWWPLPITYNAALADVRASRLLIIGSEIIAADGLLEWAVGQCNAGIAWCFRVVRENGTEIVGPRRRVALPFCISVQTEPVLRIGGWDETFCDGPNRDDNDLSARLLLAGVRFRWCDGFGNVHQEHSPFGGCGRHARSKRNERLWRNRVGGYLGSLWPLQGKGRPADAQGDGLPEQGKLCRQLLRWGYPLRSAKSSLYGGASSSQGVGYTPGGPGG